jgi:hypothetical protein
MEFATSENHSTSVSEFAAVIRLMTKADPMEMADDFFEMAMHGTNGPINFETYMHTLKTRALFRDSKDDPTVNTYNRSLQTKERFQQELLSWTSLGPVFNEFHKTHVEYEILN